MTIRVRKVGPHSLSSRTCLSITLRITTGLLAGDAASSSLYTRVPSASRCGFRPKFFDSGDIALIHTS